MKSMKTGILLAAGFTLVLMLMTGMGIFSTGREITALQKSLDQLKKEDIELQRLAQAGPKREAYVTARNMVFKARDRGNFAETKHLIDSNMKPALDAYVRSVNSVLDFQKERVDKSASSIESHFRYGSLLLIVISALAIIISVSVASIISRWLARQPGGEPTYAADIARPIAEGDLPAEVKTRDNDHASLRHAIKSMRAGLAEIVGKVRAGS